MAMNIKSTSSALANLQARASAAQSKAAAAQAQVANAQQSTVNAKNSVITAQTTAAQATSVLGQATKARDTAAGMRDRALGIAQETTASAVGWSNAAARAGTEYARGIQLQQEQYAADVAALDAANKIKMQGEAAHEARVAAGEEDNKLGKGRSLLGAASAATGAGLAMIKQPNLTFSGRRA
jgi:hypothetical protein